MPPLAYTLDRNVERGKIPSTVILQVAMRLELKDGEKPNKTYPALVEYGETCYQVWYKHLPDDVAHIEKIVIAKGKKVKSGKTKRR